MTTYITRDNIDDLLDHHIIEIANGRGRWSTIRRNGSTKRWKIDPERITVHCKVGFRDCFQIEGADFWFLPELDREESNRVRYTLASTDRLRAALDPASYRVRE